MKEKFLDYSNGYSYKNFISPAVSFGILLIWLFIWAVAFGGEFLRIDFLLLATLLLALPLIGSCKNRYVVNGEYFHVEEYNMGIKTMDINMRIEFIESVRKRWSFAYLIPKSVIVVTISGVEFEMQCLTHRDELFNTLNALKH